MKCLIVDDDPLICDLIEHFCSKIDSIKSVTTTTSGFECINLINRHAFDLIFLDFNLPDLTGKDILNIVRPNTAVIMITSNHAFGADSYNYNQVVDFLVKPVDFARFFKAFQKAKNFASKQEEKETRLFIKDGNKLVKIELTEVIYFKSEANYISVVLQDKKILTLMTLKDLEAKLPEFFMRVHRSYIVNLNKIDFINNNVIEMGKELIPVSHSYVKELLTKINLLN